MIFIQENPKQVRETIKRKIKKKKREHERTNLHAFKIYAVLLMYSTLKMFIALIIRKAVMSKKTNISKGVKLK